MEGEEGMLWTCSFALGQALVYRMILCPEVLCGTESISAYVDSVRKARTSSESC